MYIIETQKKDEAIVDKHKKDIFKINKQQAISIEIDISTNRLSVSDMNVNIEVDEIMEKRLPRISIILNFSKHRKLFHTQVFQKKKIKRITMQSLPLLISYESNINFIS